MKPRMVKTFVTGFWGTPMAFQSASPGLRRRRYPGCERGRTNPERVAFGRTNACRWPGGCNPFGVGGLSRSKPRVARSPNPGLNEGTPLAFWIALLTHNLDGTR
jgi:hypothetical protein